MLDVQHLSGGVYSDVSFNVRAGEIVGLAGLVGAGRTEIVSSIFGLDGYSEGEIQVSGQHLNAKENISKAISEGVVMATEDRRKYGLIPTRSIKENISLPYLKRIFSTYGFLKLRLEKQETQKYFDRLRVKALGLNTVTNTLSGGNQQKVILAKWLLSKPKVLILDEPTRGIDVGAKHEIYEIMKELAEEGVAIIMISSELPELIGMCKRIYVVAEGHIAGMLEGEEISQESVMTLATGGQ